MNCIHGHRTLKAPHPVRSAQLTRVPPSQYHGGGPRGNPGCCGFYFLFISCFILFRIFSRLAGFGHRIILQSDFPIMRERKRKSYQGSGGPASWALVKQRWIGYYLLRLFVLLQLASNYILGLVHQSVCQSWLVRVCQSWLVSVGWGRVGWLGVGRVRLVKWLELVRAGQSWLGLVGQVNQVRLQLVRVVRQVIGGLGRLHSVG